jgi:hypothetical protein
MFLDETALHPLTRKALVAAGWHPERKVPTEQWEAYLRDEGLHWLKSAEHFLSQFGGLTIKPIRTSESKIAADPFLIDPMDDYARLDYVGLYEEILGQDLCLLGTCTTEELVVMDEQGRIFDGHEAGFLVLLGETVQEALEVIVRAHVYPKVVYGTTRWGKAEDEKT